MKDYNVTIKVRNNFLLTAMRGAGFETGIELSKACKVLPSQIYEYLNLKKIPYTLRGEIRPSMQRICDVLNREIDDLFPPQHRHTALRKNRGETLMGREEISKLLSDIEMGAPALLTNPEEEFDMELLQDRIYDVFCSLTSREHRLLEMRFGLNGKGEHTLKEIGEVLGNKTHKDKPLTVERVRQMEAKAMRKMRHPIRSKQLKDAYRERI